MNRYDARTGRVEHIPEPEPEIRPQPGQASSAGGEYRRPSGTSGIMDVLGGLLSRAKKSVPETEDLLLVGLMYLLYKESGDIEFLLIAGALLFL